MTKSRPTPLVKALIKLLKKGINLSQVSFKSDIYKVKPAKKKPSECILVFDIASTCWASAEEMTARNPKQTHEILEIAITPITLKDLSIGETTSHIIKPRQEFAVSELCTRITGITPEMAADGVDIKEAFKAIKKQAKALNASMCASFGLYDIKMLKYQCSELDIDYPFPGGFMDLSRLCAIMLGVNQGARLGEMMQAAGMKYDQRLPKRAKLDSRRAAKLIARLWGLTRPKKAAEKEEKTIEVRSEAIVPDRIVVIQ
jgi:inhibitor of KinA sporulation pathway (predicted exonuclease)